MSEAAILQWLSGFAHEPHLVYPLIIGLLVASSFGLPFPEEATLLSAGLLTYMSLNPEQYPPPFPDAPVLNPYVMALTCLAAVFLSDALVYYLGRRFGTRITKARLFARFFRTDSWFRIERWAQKYGHWTCGIFRFTPGLRFPGHFWCGMVCIPFWKFFAIDGSAALVSVPTQVLFMTFYGEVVLKYIGNVKIGILLLLAAVVVPILIKRFRRTRQGSRQMSEVGLSLKPSDRQN